MNRNQQEENLLQIAGSINTLVCSVNFEGYLTYTNPYWEELLGWTHAELARAPVFEFIHPDDIVGSQAATNAILNEGKPLANFRNRYRKSSGEYVWLQWFASIMANGQIAASGHVVTDLVALEQENSIRSRVLDQAFSLGLMGHWIFDIATNCLTWSKEVYAIHGLNPDDGEPDIDSAINFYHPEDREKIKQLFDSALTDEIPYDFFGRIVLTSGEVRRIRTVGDVSKNKAGELVSIMGVIQDITESAALNERVELLSQVAETTTAGVVITDSQRRVVWVNGAFQTMAGYTLDEVEGRSLGKLLQGEDTSKEAIEKLKTGLNSSSDVNIEILNYRKNGTAYWNHLIISPVMKQGVLTHFIGIQQDITARKVQEARLAQALKLDAIGHLAAGICHDFNNIIGIISGSIELLEVENKDADVNHYVDNIKRASERAAGITARLLKATKHEETSQQVIGIDQEIGALTGMLMESIPNNISVSSSCNSKSEVLVNKDSLLDAVTNIVINAQQSIVHHGEIRISTQCFDAFEPKDAYVVVAPEHAGYFVKLSVADTGCGIPQASFDSIFDPFYTTKDKQNGTGLGLSQLLSFVDKGNFGLSIISIENVGTTFELWLPSQSNLRSDAPSEQPEHGNLNGKTIVIIDDEPLLAELNEIYLSSEGATVHSFISAIDALDFINKFPEAIDIVVTDLYMPGELQGNDIADFLLSQKPDTKCLILTGNANAPELQNSVHLRLGKPVKLEVLKQTICRICE